jgi:uncharacterized protein YceK
MKKVILVLSVISVLTACGSASSEKSVKCDSTCVKADSCKVDSSKKAK